MVRAISLCRRRSTGSVLQLEIPSDTISAAIEIAENEPVGNKDEAITIHLMKYIAVNCPNAGEWDIQLEPVFTIVNDGDDLDTLEDKHDYNEDIAKYWDSVDVEDGNDDDLYIGDTE